MKRRLGYTLLVILTVVLLKIISVALGWINLPSDAAVFFGISTIGTVIILSPGLYKKVWNKMIKNSSNPITINPNEEKKNEV